MKILIIMSGFFPGKKFGGPPVSTDNFCSLMKSDADCYIVTQNHDKDDKEPYPNIHEGWNNRGNAKVKYVSDAKYNRETFETAIKEIEPDFIYLQGLFQECVLPCLRLADRYAIKVVLAPRGELCAGAFRKKYKKIPYIVTLRLLGLLKGVQFQSTSDEETEAIHKYLGATYDNIFSLTNIPSIPNDLFSHLRKVAGAGRFAFISRILWKKNLLAAISFFKRIKGKAFFDIYGPKEDENYWTECEDAIKGLPDNVIVNYCGILSHDEIHKTFSQYDAFLFPTLSENYGHVIAEALVSGCIPIISDQTPWTDMNEARAGWALPLKDENGFVKAIQEVVDMDDDSIADYRSRINNYLDNKLQLAEIKKQYMAVFK